MLMLLRFKEYLSKNYLGFYQKLYRTDNRIKVLPIDFNKPWWSIYGLQKWWWAASGLLWSTALVWDTIGPIAIALSIQNSSYEFLGLSILGYLIRYTLSYSSLILAIYTEHNVRISVQYQATKFFLTVDPILHSTRSSGQAISKVARGSESTTQFTTIFIFSVLPVIVSSIVSIIIIFSISIVIGLTAIVLNVLFVTVSVLSYYYNNKTLNPIIIEQEDEQKSQQVQTLQQIQIIRSSFATIEQKNTIFKLAKSVGQVQAIKTFSVVSIATVMLFILSLGMGVIAFLLLFQVKSGNLQPVLAVAIVVGYLDSLNKIIGLTNQVEKIVTSISNIKDLFSFINGFGKQSYPVLEEDVGKNFS